MTMNIQLRNIVLLDLVARSLVPQNKLMPSQSSKPTERSWEGQTRRYTSRVRTD